MWVVVRYEPGSDADDPEYRDRFQRWEGVWEAAGYNQKEATVLAEELRRDGRRPGWLYEVWSLLQVADWEFSFGSVMDQLRNLVRAGWCAEHGEDTLRGPADLCGERPERQMAPGFRWRCACGALIIVPADGYVPEHRRVIPVPTGSPSRRT